MKILVTGSAGFVGQKLVPLLQKQGHEVIGCDIKDDSQPDHFVMMDLSLDLLRTEKKKFPDYEVCIHLASHAGGFLHNLSGDLRENEVKMMKNVVSLCDEASCKRIIYTSSINVFENDHRFSHGPLTSAEPATPYSLGKYWAEDYLQKTCDSFVVIRPTNIFSLEQPLKHQEWGYSHVIPELMKKIHTEDVLEIFGDGSQMRNFIHVDDVCDFIVHVLKSPIRGWYNLRSDIQLSILELAKKLLRYQKTDKKIKTRPEFMKYEAFSISLFDMKEVYSFGWSPKIKDIIND